MGSVSPSGAVGRGVVRCGVVRVCVTNGRGSWVGEGDAFSTPPHTPRAVPCKQKRTRIAVRHPSLGNTYTFYTNLVVVKYGYVAGARADCSVGGVHNLTHRPPPPPKGDASSRGGPDPPPKGDASQGGGPDPSPLRVTQGGGGGGGGGGSRL